MQCVQTTNQKSRKIQKFKETEDSRYIYQNELDKACFQEAMVYGDFKDLPRRIDSDNVLGDKAFNITKYPRYDECQRGLVSIVSKFFDKKTALFADKFTFGGNIKKEIVQNKELAEELNKPIIKKLKKKKVHSSFIDNIWGADLADMQLISKFNKRFWFLLCIIDNYSKYAWADFFLWKIKRVLQLLTLFHESCRKPNKIWVDKGIEFYNTSMKSWLENNDVENDVEVYYSIHNERISVAAERFIRTRKNKIYKYMTNI